MLTGVDSGWLKLFEQRVWVFWALAVFLSLLLYLTRSGTLPLLSQVGWVPETLTVGALLFVVLAVFSSINSVWNWASTRAKSKQFKRSIIAHLDSLAHKEAQILGALVHTNRRSFNTRLDNGDVHTLVQKRLLVQGSGTINVLEVPYMVPDLIWSELLNRKSEFPMPAPGKPAPWHGDWMTY